MGITTALTTVGSVPRNSKKSNMNKFLATLFLAAAATAEADPYLLGYGAGYAGLGYAGYAGYGGLGYAGYAAPYAAGYASVSPSASVNIAGHAPAALPAVGGAYAGAGRYVANSAGVVHVAKREAEADAYYGAYGLGYAGLGYAGLGYAGLGYAAPAVAAVAPVAAAVAPVAASYANVSPSASLTTLGAAPAAIPAVG